MKKALKWIGIGVGSLVVLLLLAVGLIYIISGSKLGTTYQAQATAVPLPTDSASLAQGHHLATAITKCVDCHGDNLGGKVFIDAQPLGVIVAPNLTSGKGGIGSEYTGTDWVRAIRHGVNREGGGLWIMPSDEYWYMDDRELGSIIAYVKSMPPVDNELEGSTLGILGRFLLTIGELPLIPADKIDATAGRPKSPTAGPTAAYGKHIAIIGGCVGCHGADLSGGPMAGSPPGWPDPANLTPHRDGLGRYTEEEFTQTIRTGVKKTGESMNNEHMPWRSASQMTEDEFHALWLYLQSVPPKPTGGNSEVQNS